MLAYVDLRGRPAVRFGAEDAIWEQLSWVFTHPAIYLLALPVLGIALDVISSATGAEPVCEIDQNSDALSAGPC